MGKIFRAGISTQLRGITPARRQPNSALNSRPQTSHHLHHPVSDAEGEGKDDRGDGDDHEHFDQGKSALLHGRTIERLLDSLNDLTGRVRSIASKRNLYHGGTESRRRSFADIRAGARDGCWIKEY